MVSGVSAALGGNVFKVEVGMARIKEYLNQLKAYIDSQTGWCVFQDEEGWHCWEVYDEEQATQIQKSAGVSSVWLFPKSFSCHQAIKMAKSTIAFLPKENKKIGRG